MKKIFLTLILLTCALAFGNENLSVAYNNSGDTPPPPPNGDIHGPRSEEHHV